MAGKSNGGDMPATFHDAGAGAGSSLRRDECKVSFTEERRIHEIEGGRSGDTNAWIYEEWTRRSKAVVESWLTGSTDNATAIADATRLQRCGAGGSKVLLSNEQRDVEHSKEWAGLATNFRDAYRGLCRLYGAIAIINLDESNGKAVRANERRGYLNQAKINAEQLLQPSDHDRA